MIDVGLFINDDGFVDIRVEDGDLVSDDGLETAILASLFSDKRVSADEKPVDEPLRRGWWGDLYPDVANDLIGSKLWLLSREKRTETTLIAFEDEAKASLQWLVDDGIASEVKASASYLEDGAMILEINIIRDKKENKFSLFWDGQKLKRA